MKKIISITLLTVFLSVLTGCETFRKPKTEEVSVETSTETSTELSTETSPEEPSSEEKVAEKESEPAKKEEKPATSTKSAETSAKVSTNVSVKADPAVRTFNVTAKKFSFSPSTITVNEGETVKINVSSEDVTHGFLIAEYGINKVLNPGAKETIEFIADQKGTFTIRCSIFCGVGHPGMTGTLIVQ